MYWFYYKSHILGVSDCNISVIHQFLKDKHIPSESITVKKADEFSIEFYATQEDILESISFYFEVK